jgi:predicted nucleic acid-binding protein
LKRAADLARRFTRVLGYRSLDVFHVASAVELELRVFVTFDERQRELARTARLKVAMLA